MPKYLSVHHPTRERQKINEGAFSYWYTVNGQKGYYVRNNDVLYQKFVDHPHRPCNCSSYRCSLYDGHDVTIFGNPHYTNDLPPYYFGDMLEHIRPRTIEMVNDLDWKKLRYSNEFGLIQFIAELDETLLTFTKKFWAEFSYGSFTWGILPFVSDIKAILSQIKRLQEKYDQFDGMEYTDIIKEDFDYEFLSSPHSRTYQVTGTIKCSNRGLIFPPALFDTDGIDIAALYDLLGFQPSLSTAWDLIPLSFLVDYLLPVGDFLDNLKSSEGWTRHCLFRGWSSTKITARVENGKLTANYGYAPVKSNFLIREYSRKYRTAILNDITYKPKINWFDYPSFKELFNWWYVLGRGDLKKIPILGRL